MPYIVGHPIKKPADFYGRHEQVIRFYEIIGGTQAQSASVLGLRRAGKTSFLQYVAHEEVMARYLPDPGNYVMAYVDMSSCKTPAVFYQRLLGRLKNALGQPEQVVLWKASPPGATSMYDVESLLCQHPDRRIILLLDEFDQLRTDSFDQDFLTELRALTSVLDYDLACVTASYWDLYHLGARIGLPPTSPFYNIFYPTPIFLPGLATAESDNLIRAPAQRAGAPFTDEDVAHIRRLAGSLPFFLQATAAHWFRAKRAGRALNVSAALSQLVVEMSPYFVQWWRHFNSCQRDLLQAVTAAASLDDLPYKPSEVVEAIRRLRSFGILLEQGDALAINGAICAAWIRQYADQAPVANGSAASPETITDPATLRRTLVNHFDMEELRTLCFDLDVDFDQLSGANKGAKARDLIIYWHRQGKLNRLVEAIRLERGAIV